MSKCFQDDDRPNRQLGSRRFKRFKPFKSVKALRAKKIVPIPTFSGKKSSDLEAALDASGILRETSKTAQILLVFNDPRHTMFYYGKNNGRRLCGKSF